MSTRGIKCKDFQNSLYALDKAEKEKITLNRFSESARKEDGALIGSALCMALAKNPKACTQGAMESLENDDERNRRIQNQNQQRIRQLEIESQQQKLLLEQQNQKKDIREILKNCSPSGRFC